jgi:hypothetical protein
MKWLIWGNDWIYKNLVKYIPEEIETICAESRAYDEKKVKMEINSIKPDRVIYLIGNIKGPPSDIDYLESTNSEEFRQKLNINIRDNLFGPLQLSIICNELQIHYTYVGTGSIFTYDEDKSIKTEEDNSDFFGTSYSIVKGYTDRLMKLNDNTLNVRIRLPISDNIYDKNSFISKIINYPQIISIPNSVSVLSDVLPILIDMIVNKKFGTINLVNPETITHKQIKEFYVKYVDSNHLYRLINVTDQDKLNLLSSNICLETKKLTNMYVYIPTAYESIENIFKKCTLINRFL